ncbi:MAG TPA: low affinity iron permease family protein [Kofleriaceae bacterium]|nr:low affinity iron permease family protein [Kofleriaceae bacterium]
MANLKDLLEDSFEAFAARASAATGSFWAFVLAMMIVAVWALAGPPFDFSENWQLVINTGTTIVTFLMVFLIQHSQNKETRALQLKLNELIAAMMGASNRLIDIEDLTDREIDYLYRRYQHLARSAERLEPGASTSIEKEPEGDEPRPRSRPRKSGQS